MRELLLVDMAKRVARAKGVTLSRVSFLAAGDGKFFNRLIDGRTCTLRVERVVLQYLHENWPDGETWPDAISRPTPRSKSERGTAA